MPPTRPGNLGVAPAGTFTPPAACFPKPGGGPAAGTKGGCEHRRRELAAGVAPREDTWEVLNEQADTC